MKNDKRKMTERAYAIKFPSKKSLTDLFYLLTNITVFSILAANDTTGGLGPDLINQLCFQYTLVASDLVLNRLQLLYLSDISFQKFR